MRHLNYTHLLYFWTVAREGSIARASEVLHLTPQTISGQLKKLEDSVGEPLFGKAGRGLTLTETGHVVNEYADEIFQLGSELAQRVRSKQALVPSVLNVGIVNSVPKLIAQRVLQPALMLDDPVKIAETGADQRTVPGDEAPPVKPLAPEPSETANAGRNDRGRPGGPRTPEQRPSRNLPGARECRRPTSSDHFSAYSQQERTLRHDHSR